MVQSFLKFGAMSLILLTVVSAASPVSACGHYNDSYYNDSYREYNQDRRGYRGSRYDRESRYDRGDQYDRNYRGNRCDKGTGGTIIGAIAGGLLGHEIVGRRGDRTAGVIIGAGVGALTGRAIDRSNGRRC